MRIARFISGGTVHLGRPVKGDRPSLAAGDQAAELAGDLLGALKETGRTLSVEKLLAPLVPTDLLCIGLNYRRHAAETHGQIPQRPLLFIKSGNTLNHPFAAIPIPRLSTQIDYEGELAVVIGKMAKHVRREQALEHVLGYTIANDVSSRDWQRDPALGGGQFARGKSFDGFCPLGPHIVTADEIANPNALRLRTTLNGELMQDQTTGDMIFDVPAIIESLSSTMTLRPGTVILTGTPEGVGMARTPPVWLREGDRIAVEIEAIGRLENVVKNEP
jgi:2-keto-4-pentenoate hydratase/2-oxohepta-3-ene-1,7-dioic acid hydratase in catechol pathway